ncbi:MAG: hypothetical protein A2Y33_09185 [Spirochaetes bacterium GWF1_51_8]|nr:MAG: hypothetical protein A2Y33_09185 [Spirochaetes bacterium GWF1_51_8]
MEKRDLKKEMKNFYGQKPGEPSIVELPEWNYLAIEGQGDPNKSAEYMEALNALYPVAYAIKFMVKKAPPEIDFGVMPLEGLWWADDLSSFTESKRDLWKWRMMILQPGFVTREMYGRAVEDVRRKKNPAALGKLRFEPYREGLCAQILHVGPFTEEPATIRKLHDFITAQGYRNRDYHHEIYLTDIRRTIPAKWKTIIRQPMDKI